MCVTLFRAHSTMSLGPPGVPGHPPRPRRKVPSPLVAQNLVLARGGNVLQKGPRTMESFMAKELFSLVMANTWFMQDKG